MAHLFIKCKFNHHRRWFSLGGEDGENDEYIFRWFTKLFFAWKHCGQNGYRIDAGFGDFCSRLSEIFCLLLEWLNLVKPLVELSKNAGIHVQNKQERNLISLSRRMMLVLIGVLYVPGGTNGEPSSNPGGDCLFRFGVRPLEKTWIFLLSSNYGLPWVWKRSKMERILNSKSKQRIYGLNTCIFRSHQLQGLQLKWYRPWVVSFDFMRSVDWFKEI